MDNSEVTASTLQNIRQCFFQMRIQYELDRRKFNKAVIYRTLKYSLFGSIGILFLSYLVLDPSTIGFIQGLVGEYYFGVFLVLTGLVYLLIRKTVRHYVTDNEWEKLFEQFISVRFDLLGRLKVLFNNDWVVLYSNNMSAYEYVKPEDIVPIQPFGIYGGSEKSSLGGTFKNLQPFKKPIDIQAQIYLYSLEESTTLGFGDSQYAVLATIGKEQTNIEFEGFLKDEQSLP